MWIWQVLFGLALAAAAYIVEKVVTYPTTAPVVLGGPLPKRMLEAFVAIVFIFWVLGLFGIGR